MLEPKQPHYTSDIWLYRHACQYIIPLAKSGGSHQKSQPNCLTPSAGSQRRSCKGFGTLSLYKRGRLPLHPFRRDGGWVIQPLCTPDRTAASGTDHQHIRSWVFSWCQSVEPRLPMSITIAPESLRRGLYNMPVDACRAAGVWKPCQPFEMV